MPGIFISQINGGLILPENNWYKGGF